MLKTPLFDQECGTCGPKSGVVSLQQKFYQVSRYPKEVISLLEWTQKLSSAQQVTVYTSAGRGPGGGSNDFYKAAGGSNYRAGGAASASDSGGGAAPLKDQLLRRSPTLNIISRERGLFCYCLHEKVLWSRFGSFW